MSKELSVVVEKNRQGRPLGFKLSEESKNKIRQSRIGKRHTQETKNKISKSRIKYYEEKDKLTDSLHYDYRFYQDGAHDWIDTNKAAINTCNNVLSNKKLSYLNQVERGCGDDIYKLFSHNITPEFVLLLKEELLSKGLLYEIDILNSIL